MRGSCVRTGMRVRRPRRYLLEAYTASSNTRTAVQRLAVVDNNTAWSPSATRNASGLSTKCPWRSAMRCRNGMMSPTDGGDDPATTVNVLVRHTHVELLGEFCQGHAVRLIVKIAVTSTRSRIAAEQPRTMRGQSTRNLHQTGCTTKSWSSSSLV